MTEVRIRPFEDRDYPAIVAVGNAVYTDYPWSVEEYRHEDMRYDGGKYLLRRFVAEHPGDRVVAYADFHHMASMYHPRKFWLELVVHAAVQRQGIGSRLYDHLVGALAPHEPLVLWTNIRETFPHSIRFAERRGFREVRRAWESRLDVAAFDPAPFEAKASEAVLKMAVTTVAEERERDRQWLEKLYDLHTDVRADVPQPDDYTVQTLEEFQQQLVDHPDYLPDGHFLAKDGDADVAESFVFRSHELRDVLYQALTGTRRTHRGRGIAVALKLRVIDYARSRGYREIRTWNDTLNAPMLAINTKLGFVRQPAWITFEKTPG